MSLEDTELSAELIVNTVINSAQREMDDGQGSSTDYNSISSSPELHKLVLLMHVSNYEGQAVEPELFTQSKIRELCLSSRGHCDPYEIEILSDHEACLTFEKDVMLGLVAGDLMLVEDWMGVPIVITVIILGRSKIWAILDARERHRQSLKERTYEEGREDEERLQQMDREKDKLEQEARDYAGRQKELGKLVESLTDKVQKLETQPVSGKGLVMSSAQNLSNSFGNLTTSFQVKADLDLGKFSGTEPVPNNELTFNQWRVDVQSYQVNVPDHILLPAIRKSIIGKAQSVVRTFGPSYTVEDVIKCLAREYEGVASRTLQVEMDKMSKQLKAFTVGPLGFYECERMPFGLSNAPATFQRLMESFLGELHLNWCIIYLDDIIVFSKMPKEHIERLRGVFNKLVQAGLRLKPKKCKFFKSKISYLRHSLFKRNRNRSK